MQNCHKSSDTEVPLRVRTLDLFPELGLLNPVGFQRRAESFRILSRCNSLVTLMFLYVLILVTACKRFWLEGCLDLLSHVSSASVQEYSSSASVESTHKGVNQRSKYLI